MSTMIRGASHTGAKTSEESAAMHDERRRRRTGVHRTFDGDGGPLSLIRIRMINYFECTFFIFDINM